jgi:hypothetical protein
VKMKIAMMIILAMSDRSDDIDHETHGGLIGWF